MLPRAAPATSVFLWVIPSRLVSILGTYQSQTTQQTLRRPLTTRELGRLRRYSSWMRRLEIRGWELSEELTRLVLPSPGGTPPVLPLHLQELHWGFDKTNFSLLPVFLSRYLTGILITAGAITHPGEVVVPGNTLPDKLAGVMRSAIKMFPPSLQNLAIQLGSGPQTQFTEEMSAFVLGCGETLQMFNTNVVLSTSAIVHLMKLPNLCTWVTEQGPPQVSDLIRHGVPDGAASLFPSLENLNIKGDVTLEWLPLFGVTQDRTPPWILADGNPPAITYSGQFGSLTLDSSLISRFLPLTELVDVQIKVGCLFRPCASQLTDQDVECLAIALPKLKALTLGDYPCGCDTCPTTIRSLLSLSIHCTQLKYLNIHFRMANLRADMLDTLADAYSQGLHSRPKCVLETLVVQEMRLELPDYDPILISMGMLMIFPSLTKFVSVQLSPAWFLLEMLMKVMAQIGEVSIVTEQLMRCLGAARESVDDGVPMRSAVSSRLSSGLTGKRGSRH